MYKKIIITTNTDITNNLSAKKGQLFINVKSCVNHTTLFEDFILWKAENFARYNNITKVYTYSVSTVLINYLIEENGETI